jgi:cytochrome c biogenesis protein CcdA
MFSSGMLLAAASALWLGILTSLSPCPLATNIAAVSFVGKSITTPRKVFAAGVLYTLGRTLAYGVLGVILVSSLLSAPALSYSLQKYMNLLLGPLLILVGMVLTDLLSLPPSLGNFGPSTEKASRFQGLWGAGALGILFALSFCPTSAALFFGSLLPLALQYHSGVLLPSLYGIATGLPVLFFALLLSLGTAKVGRAFEKVQTFELKARRFTGGLFILLGIYYSLTHIFNLDLNFF